MGTDYATRPAWQPLDGALSTPADAHDFSRDRRVTRLALLAFGLYFAGQFVLRIWLPPNLELDEAEQLVLTQELAWVYGIQPPLYTWLQTGVFALTGPTVAGLALLKNVLLWSTYAAVFGLVRELTGSAPRALLAALLLLWVPQIVWESQRDLTHSVLVTTVAAVTLWLFVRLVRRPLVINFLIVGLVTGIGVLSKYNFALLSAALMAAGATVAPIRQAVFRRELIVAVAAAAIVCAPHFASVLYHWEMVSGGAHQLDLQHTGTLTGRVGAGSVNLIGAAAGYAGPLLVIGPILVWAGAGRESWRRRDPWVAFFIRLMVAVLGVCGLLILFPGITTFKDRWMQPLLFYLPVVVVLLHGREPSARLLRWAGAAGIVIAATVMLALFARSTPGLTNRHNESYAGLAEAIRSKELAAPAWIAEDVHLAGNLRLRFPASRFVAPGASMIGLPRGTTVMLAWREQHGTRVPGPVIELARRVTPDLRLADRARRIAPAAGPDGVEPVRLLLLPGRPGAGETGRARR